MARIIYTPSGGDGPVGDTTRDDPVEVAQVCGHVERESVRGDGLRNMHPDGGNLLFANASTS